MGALGAGQTFFNHIGSSLGDGMVGIYDHVTGDTDHERAVLNDAKTEDEKSRQMLKGVLGGDHGLAATLGEAAADKLYAHQYPDAAAELNQDAAGQWAKAKSGVANEAYNDPITFALNVVPVAGLGRAAAVAKLGRAAEAADAAASAASKAGDAGRAASLARQAGAFRQTARALEGGKAGEVLRRAKAVAVRKAAARARLAGAKARARRLGGASAARDPHDPYARHTPESLKKAKDDAAKMHDRWQGQGRPVGHEQPALAHAGGGGGGATTHPIGRPGVMKMAGKGEVGENLSLTERIRRNRNLKTRPKVAPVVSVKKDYHTFDLAQKSKEFRKKTGYYGTSNVVVIEYDGPRDLSGNLPTVAVKSIPQGDPNGLAQIHSEPLGLLELEKAGVPLSKVTRVYTERAPCMSPRNYCATLLASELPGVPVYHSFEFGTTEESMAAGNAALEKELRILKKQTEAAEGLK